MIAKTAHFDVFFHDGDNQTAKTVAEETEEFHSDLVKFYGGEPGRVSVFVMESSSEYASLNGFAPGEEAEVGNGSYAGSASQGSVYLLRPLNAGLVQPGPSRKCVESHETGHAYFSKLYPGLVRPVHLWWIDEAMASNACDFFDGIPATAATAERVLESREQELSMQRMTLAQAENASRSNGNVGQARGMPISVGAALLHFITDKEGQSGVHDFLRAYNSTQNIGTAVVPLGYPSLAQLQADLDAWLASSKGN